MTAVSQKIIFRLPEIKIEYHNHRNDDHRIDNIPVIIRSSCFSYLFFGGRSEGEAGNGGRIFCPGKVTDDHHRNNNNKEEVDFIMEPVMHEEYLIYQRGIRNTIRKDIESETCHSKGK